MAPKEGKAVVPLAESCVNGTSPCSALAMVS